MPYDGNTNDYASDPVLLAADHIEQHPELYDFFKPTVPACGTPGCLLGWISHFAGSKRTLFCDVARDFFGYSDASKFYNEMDRVAESGWKRDAAKAMRGLRVLAGERVEELA